MKKASVIFADIFLMGFSGVFALGNAERGNGDRIASERAVSFFDEIETSHDPGIRGNTGGGAILRIHSDREYRASVGIDSNLDSFIID
jgi:hypothetical protein